MSLLDFFFPDVAQATHLRRIADQSSLSSTQQRIASMQQQARSGVNEQRIANLENELAEMCLMVESLIEVLEDKQVLSRSELAQKVHEVDARDGVIDGKITKQVPAAKKPFQAKLKF
ncbi:hypothetical protein [Persicirhabdus sediminis]|uniref:Uncharacterized protein n=1 Tax=Persicirhabdus sediminis TaxID=454144 RepID=A0A8J7MHU9_9BACT|nr:hypothetical protein [Persicirhabdus sediminis]MBK1791623.1 hypothetical protein [Persicirhabdus sediminis]